MLGWLTLGSAVEFICSNDPNKTSGFAVCPLSISLPCPRTLTEAFEKLIFPKFKCPLTRWTRRYRACPETLNSSSANQETSHVLWKTNFNTIFQKFFHLLLIWVKLIQPARSHIYLGSVLTVSCYIRVDLPRVFTPTYLPSEILNAFFVSPLNIICPTQFDTEELDHTSNIWWCTICESHPHCVQHFSVGMDRWNKNA